MRTVKKAPGIHYAIPEGQFEFGEGARIIRGAQFCDEIAEECTGRPKLKINLGKAGDSGAITVEEQWSKNRKRARIQYAFRRDCGGVIHSTGVFAAVFHPRRDRTPSVDASIGWSLANLWEGDSFYTDQGIRQSIYRAYKEESSDWLPPSMILPAIFFATSVTRDCVRMAVSRRKKDPGKWKDLGKELLHPYPHYVNIHGLVPVRYLDLKHMLFSTWNITRCFFMMDNLLSSWSIPHGPNSLMDTAKIPLDSAREVEWRYSMVKPNHEDLEEFAPILKRDVMISRIIKRLKSVVDRQDVSTLNRHVKPLVLFS